jgi:hypothetical protein
VACGPGNFTHVFAGALTGDGLAVGLDASAPMLARAVRENLVPRVAYLRADARRMPFPDASFDAVCCYAALYLVPEPFTVLVEMLRVLAPGGRIALMTSYRGSWEPQRAVRTMLGWASGVRMFDRDELTGILRASGLVDIQQQLTAWRSSSPPAARPDGVVAGQGAPGSRPQRGLRQVGLHCPAIPTSHPRGTMADQDSAQPEELDITGTEHGGVHEAPDGAPLHPLIDLTRDPTPGQPDHARPEDDAAVTRRTGRVSRPPAG